MEVHGKDILEVMDNNSYMDYNGESEDSMSFSTRNNGDVGGEEYGKEDYIHAKKMGEKILSVLPSNSSVNIETCDEWVYLVAKVK